MAKHLEIQINVNERNCQAGNENAINKNDIP